jgi:fructokinase
VACFGGVEIGGSHLVCAIGAGPADLHVVSLPVSADPSGALIGALDFFRGSARPLAAVGVACFGPLDLDPSSRSFGFVTATPKGGWSFVDVRGTLARDLAAPVFIDTDVNGAALGEATWGAGIGIDPIVYLTVGTGIGGGAIVNGRPIHGLVHPEMGHMRVPRAPDDTFVGTCPFHRDCLEGLASGLAVRMRTGLPGEALAVDDPVWALEARYLALGLANVIGVLSPRRIVVGGGVMRHPTLLARVRTEVQAVLGGYVRAPAVTDTIDRYIVPPALGERAGVLGAIALAQRCLRETE